MKRAAVALIDEVRCIGCARCLDACPVDAIIGARQQMHTVVASWCIGCKLCLPPCPVDCIDMVPAAEAFTSDLKEKAARRARHRKIRLTEKPFPAKNRKAILAAVLARKRKT